MRAIREQPKLRKFYGVVEEGRLVGALEAPEIKGLKHVFEDSVMNESFLRFKRAQEILEPYRKKFMSEEMIRRYIHEVGIPTFSRPQGIPENFLIEISKKSAGMEYVHPTDIHHRVRVMLGKPHSSFLDQQKPYVVHMKNGKALAKFGNQVEKSSPEAHIPINEFIYRGD